MGRRKTKLMKWLISAMASGCCAISPALAVAQSPDLSDPGLICPLAEFGLAENQCSDYLYRSYDEEPSLGRVATLGTHDFPPAPYDVPAVDDSLAGHEPQYYGCGDYDRPLRVARRRHDYWGEDTIKAPAIAKTYTAFDFQNDLDQLEHVAQTLLNSLVRKSEGFVFQGTCYEQTIYGRMEFSPRDAAAFAAKRNGSWKSLVDSVVDDAVQPVNRLKEEYLPYDLVGTRAPFAAPTSYWEAHADLDIDATRSADASDYWAVHRDLDIDARFPRAAVTIRALRAAPALAMTYTDWAANHRYVKQPRELKLDLYHQVEMRLCGTPALDHWIQLAYGPAPVRRPQASQAMVRVSALWLADLLGHTGQRLLTTSDVLSLWAGTEEVESQIR